MWGRSRPSQPWTRRSADVSLTFPPVCTPGRSYCRGVAPTSAADALVIVFNALPDEERVEALERINEAHLRVVGGEQSDTAQMLRSLQRVAEYVGHPASVDEYRQASKEPHETRGVRH